MGYAAPNQQVAIPLARQYVRLQELWTNVYRPLVVSTDGEDRKKAEHAVNAMYAILGYPKPKIDWVCQFKLSLYGGKWFFPADLPNYGEPLVNIRNSLMFAGWCGLDSVERSAREIGYRQGRFHLPINKRTILRDKYLPRRRQRPSWFVNGDNLFCRFDTDALALFALAKSEKLPLLRVNILELARAAEKLLKHAFGAFFFRYGVWMVPTPKRIDLDENHTIMAEYPNPSFVFCDDTKVWSRNGIVLWPGQQEPQATSVNLCNQIDSETPGRRGALIDYYGWNRVLEESKKHNRAQHVSTDDYGELWRVRFRGGHNFLVVQVTNSTAHPDGHFERFTIPVDARCRPLPDPNNPFDTFGPPQPLTPLNAVASTFGKLGHEYRSMMGVQT